MKKEAKTFSRLLVPGLSTIVMLGILLGLGTWQVQRLAWKRGLLAQIDAAEAAPPVPLIGAPPPFAKVRLVGRMRDDLMGFYGAAVHDVGGLGSTLIEPMERDGADPVLVMRGWVPDKRTQPIPPGPSEVEGYVRAAEQPGWFSAPDDPVARRFYTLDPAAIGAALGLAHVAPFVLVAMGTPPPGGYPEPATHLPRPPNDHLSYAITWYGLAAVLAVIFGLYARKVLRP